MIGGIAIPMGPRCRILTAFRTYEEPTPQIWNQITFAENVKDD